MKDTGWIFCGTEGSKAIIEEKGHTGRKCVPWDLIHVSPCAPAVTQLLICTGTTLSASRPARTSLLRCSVSEFQNTAAFLKDGGLVFETANPAEVDLPYLRHLSNLQYPDHLFFFGTDHLRRLRPQTIIVAQKRKETGLRVGG